MTASDLSNHGRTPSTRYTLLEKLGAGGQAEVWRARDNSSGVEVALKVLGPQLAHDDAVWAALGREFTIASRMDHPAILKVYPPYREGNFVALPMELATGGDLRRLRGKSYLDIIPVLIEIAQGLEYAHEHGVIHRDLKPGNVLFDGSGAVRIADFGIAGAPGEVNPAVVRPGLSPFTASPEQLRGDPPAISDDIYGLGALAYELLSGYPPYYPRFEVKRALDEPVPELKPAQIMPHQLVNAIMRMLAKRAALRQRSMREVIDEFDSALNDTLTFNYDSAQEPADPAAASMRRDAAKLAAAEAAAARAAASPAQPAPGFDHDHDELQVTGALAKRAPAPPPPSASAPPSPSHSSARTNESPGSRTDATEHRRKYRDQPSIAAQAAALLQSRDLDEEVIGDDDVAVEFAPPPAPPAETGTIERQRIAAAAAAVREVAPDLVTPSAPPTFWDDSRLRADRTPLRQRKPPRAPRKSWPWVMLTTLAVAAGVVYFVLPKYGPIGSLDELKQTAALAAASFKESTSSLLGTSRAKPANGPSDEAPMPPSDNVAAASPAPGLEASKESVFDARATSASSTTALPAANASASPSGVDAGRVEPGRVEKATPATPAVEVASPEAVAQMRTSYDQRLAALEARGAGFWGGPDFAAAKTRAAEASGANDAGSTPIAEKRLKEALRLLAVVESRASQALTAQLTAGDNALAAGQGEVAKQAYESARRIDPNNRRAQEGLQRVRNLGGLLPLLADGENAESANDFARAVQDYSQALSLDPNNAKAKAGLARAHAAFGEDSYAKAVGSGFAALGAGRLEDARIAFEKARTIRPNGTEAATGLSRVGAALRARGFASTRQRGSGLEAEERWTDAVAEYDAALKVDPSLVFAQQGKARASSRAELNDSLQALIDRPERMASPAVRAEADTLIKRASVQEPIGPVLRSQIQRLQILLPGFDVPVRLEMLSDNATQVQIQRVGTFGSFSKREIELKPGKYTVVGTRPGFRDVRRDVTIAPGGDVQTISVSCVEPI